MTEILTLLEKEIQRFLKVIIQTVVSPLVSSFLYLLVFGVSLGSMVPNTDGIPYLGFLIPGLMMMSLINNAFQNSSSSIVTSKFSGDLEDLRVAPLSNHQIIIALALGALVRGFIVSVVTYTVGTFFYFFQYHSFLGVAHPLLLLFFLIFAGLTFGLLGIMVAFMAKTMDQLSAFSAFVLLPLTYLGGVFISIKTLHPFWQMISRFNPLLYLINGLRYGFLGVTDVDIGLGMVVTVICFVTFYMAAYLSLKKGSFQRW